ncbi:MAG: 30S ribosomal protein S16 [Planctomycetota bacterium]
MVRIRMQRLGRRNRPFYRINAMDSRTRRNGAVIENLGWYDPVAPDEDKQVHLKEERIRHWLEKGAQPSDTMADMLGKRGLLPEKMHAAWEKDRRVKRERVEKIQAEKRAAEEAAAKAEAEAKAAEEAAKAAEEAEKAAEAESGE